MIDNEKLEKLGWQPFFQQQLSLEELEDAFAVRVVEQHRSELLVLGQAGTQKLSVLSSMPALVVGDWLLLDQDQGFLRLLDRKTYFSRRSAGTQAKMQLLSANVDTVFIVCSMNDDFNLNRIERYLSLVNESGAFPVVLLSKSDLVDDADAFVAEVQAIDPLLMVMAINTLDCDAAEKLTPWLNKGETVAVLGSSGVGKSTLINTLSDSDAQATGGIRESDAKGRHTTTSRALISLDSGALIIDTPGMREIQLAESKEGIAKTFGDIESLALECKFGDCQHIDEPGCAVKQAVEADELDERRLQNYLKLLREEAFNSASVAERRANDKAFGKFVKKTIGEATKLKGR